MSTAQVATIPVLAAASATAVCASQTPSGAGLLTINGGSASGGVATLAAARRILFTTVSDESAKKFQITGQDRAGNWQTETVTGPNASTAYTAFDYATVTKISVSAALTGAVTVGTNAVASSKWIVLDYQRAVFNVSAVIGFAGQSGSVNLEVTLDNISTATTASAPGGNGDMSQTGIAFTTYTLPTVVTASGSPITSNSLTSIGYPVRAIRITSNSGATVSPITLTVIQSGL
jgi:hypothetical protein